MPPLTITHKASKRQVDYSRGHREAHCGKVFADDKGYCRYFIKTQIADAGECQKVEGSIHPLWWCRLFSKAIT